MRTKKIRTGILVCSAFLASLSTLPGCGEDPGLYQQESIYFDSGKESSELDLDEESSDFSFYGFYVAPYAPWPLFEYYKHPLPVAVPINPVDNLIDWVHPMYIGQFLSGEFGRGSH